MKKEKVITLPNIEFDPDNNSIPAHIFRILDRLDKIENRLKKLEKVKEKEEGKIPIGIGK